MESKTKLLLLTAVAVLISVVALLYWPSHEKPAVEEPEPQVAHSSQPQAIAQAPSHTASPSPKPVPTQEKTVTEPSPQPSKSPLPPKSDDEIEAEFSDKMIPFEQLRPNCEFLTQGQLKHPMNMLVTPEGRIAGLRFLTAGPQDEAEIKKILITLKRECRFDPYTEGGKAVPIKTQYFPTSN